MNTSGEDAKGGVTPLKYGDNAGELVDLAQFILKECPRLRLHGLMTIGSLSESLSSDENNDFRTLIAARDALQALLGNDTKEKWGDGEGKLLLSMGMSSDFEEALKVGSDIVRVGTGIFGGRKTKEEAKSS